ITLRLRRLLVPVDFSDNSRKAIRFAAALAAKGEGYVILLHARSGAADPGERDTSKKLRRLADDTRKHFQVPVHAVTVAGKPPSAIVEAAGRYCADLVVMGTRGSESESSFFFGPNA